MAPKASSYAERNKFWIKLLDESENLVYTLHWKPLPDAADSTTTDGSPDWDVIKAVPANIDIDIADTSGSGF